MPSFLRNRYPPANDEIEATFEYSDKSHANEMGLKDGEYKCIPYNINDMTGFIPIKEQSFMVDLNSWGNVNFISEEIAGERYTDLSFYLTVKEGNILYELMLGATMVNLDVKAVSFQDVNKDGLKDIIILVHDIPTHVGYGKQYAIIFFQNTDGFFKNDSDIDKEINNSGNNIDISTVTNYLSEKF